VSNSNSDGLQQRLTPSSIAEFVRQRRPMGDLGRFLIDDLTPTEEDEFFAILEDV
jgi:hypothetical protein